MTIRSSPKRKEKVKKKLEITRGRNNMARKNMGK